MKPISLSTGLGEVMASQTLVLPLVITSDGAITIQPGALHGRSEAEQGIQFVKQREELGTVTPHRFVWVAVELDAAEKPVRYKGISVSEVWIDRQKGIGYKPLAEAVNRISEAIRGGVNLKVLGAAERELVAKQLQALEGCVWESSEAALREALTR